MQTAAGNWYPFPWLTLSPTPATLLFFFFFYTLLSLW
jgi:hypothetical protein